MQSPALNSSSLRSKPKGRQRRPLGRATQLRLSGVGEKLKRLPRTRRNHMPNVVRGPALLFLNLASELFSRKVAGRRGHGRQCLVSGYFTVLEGKGDDQVLGALFRAAVAELRGLRRGIEDVRRSRLKSRWPAAQLLQPC